MAQEEACYLPLCRVCEEPMKRFRVRKPNRNNGRFFFSCEDDGEFVWEDEIEVNPGTQRPATSSQTSADSQQQIFRSINHPRFKFLATPHPETFVVPKLINDCKFGLKTRYNTSLIEHIKALPVELREWDPERMMWLFLRSSYDQVMEHIQQGDFIISPKHKAELDPVLGTPSTSSPSLTHHQTSRTQHMEAGTTARVLFPDSATAGPLQLQDPSRSQKQVPKVETQHDEDSTCIICMDKPREYALVPCGHLRFCLECAERTVGQGNCPECDKAVQQCIKIYL